MTPCVTTDAGRSKSKYPKEYMDCTVRALALARNISYDKAHSILERAGRKYGKRFNMYEWLLKRDWAKVKEFKATRYERTTITKFCNTHKIGIWIVRIYGHVFMVKNGVRYDTLDNGNTNRCLVYNAFRIKTKKRNEKKA